MILGDSYITFNRKMSNFRGHFVSLESKFRGHLKQKQAKSRFFEGQGKPWSDQGPTKGFDSCEFGFQVAFFNLNTAVNFLG